MAFSLLHLNVIAQILKFGFADFRCVRSVPATAEVEFSSARRRGNQAAKKKVQLACSCCETDTRRRNLFFLLTQAEEMISPEHLREFLPFKAVDVDPIALRELAQHSQRVKFARGEVLLQEDEVPDKVFLLVNGDCIVTKRVRAYVELRCPNSSLAFQFKPADSVLALRAASNRSSSHTLAVLGAGTVVGAVCLMQKICHELASLGIDAESTETVESRLTGIGTLTPSYLAKISVAANMRATTSAGGKRADGSSVPQHKRVHSRQPTAGAASAETEASTESHAHGRRHGHGPGAPHTKHSAAAPNEPLQGREAVQALHALRRGSADRQRIMKLRGHPTQFETITCNTAVEAIAVDAKPFISLFRKQPFLLNRVLTALMIIQSTRRNRYREMVRVVFERPC